MKNKIFFLFIFLIFFSLNLYTYAIKNIDTKIIVKEDGILEITDTVILERAFSEEKIVLSIPTIYDLKVKSDYKKFSYNYYSDSLEINLATCCFSNGLIEFEMTYLTDLYTSKNGNIWSINYTPFLRGYVDFFSIYFLEGTKFIDLSENRNNFIIKDNKFIYITDFPLSNYSVDYFVVFDSFPKKEYLRNYFLIGFLSLIFIGGFILFRRKCLFLKKYL